MRVNGEQADSRTVASLLSDKPPEVGADDHHVVGLWFDDELAGVASFVVGWPSPDITYLGLLQLRTNHQGRGLARAFHEALRTEFPGRWCLTVVDTNAEVLPFWERLGTRARGKRKSGPVIRAFATKLLSWNFRLHASALHRSARCPHREHFSRFSSQCP